MSESTFCPYCNAKLRLGSSSTSRRRTTRVKCRVCRRKFHPNLVYTADGQQLPLNEPLTAGAGERDDHEAHADRRRHSHDREPPEPIPPPSDESIDPTVKKAAFPSHEPVREKRAHGWREKIKERAGHKRSRRLAKIFRLALAIGLLAVGVGGAGYLAWSYLKPTLTPDGRSDTVADTPSFEELAKEASILASDLAPKPLPRRLIGIWELRSDDERHGWVDFQADSTMRAFAWIGSAEERPSFAHWYLREEFGDNLIIEIGEARGTIGNLLFHLTIVGREPEAFTLTKVVQRSIPSVENRRFVRRTKPVPADPKNKPANRTDRSEIQK